MLDYNLEAIKKHVLEKYPNEPGELYTLHNCTTSPIFAYAVFTFGKEGDEVVLEDIDTVNYYGLWIKVQRTKTVARHKQAFAS